MSFTIGRKGENLERVSFEHFDISLLARGDGSEVIIQRISKDNLFYVYPGDNPNVMEFVYILQGEMFCELNGEKVYMGPHDYFTSTDLKEPIHFTTLSEVIYIWVITEPTFYQLSESVQSLKAVVDEVEKKDKYTHKHSERVSEYAVKIARKLSLPKGKLENLYIASILHDIGKIHTPGEILNKPDKLTDEEFAVIKRHPLEGSEMVKDLYYQDIVAIIEQHHERLDGTGYPRGLKGDEIRLESRIIAVSDTFDAMTEDRAYRKAFSVRFAMDELKRLASTHYDSKVVNAFEEILKEEERL
ncbi:HD domain-containing protein [Bacillus infantis]|uniref:HD-GYP domain-containing protein n=1 Tax=Bacillus infantis TaxID=324767 RepID=UPI001CD60FC2|nr:HD-GYP domain-containing protein [Bacillus infantis]MCA1041140.1 HD domain-containing protein [Bacillus infantis]